VFFIVTEKLSASWNGAKKKVVIVFVRFQGRRTVHMVLSAAAQIQV
jgi:hypothetical protein